MLEVTRRHIFRMVKRYQKAGDLGLIHRLRGQGSNRGYPKRLEAESWSSTGDPSTGITARACSAEVLASDHRISVDDETVRRWLMAEGGIQMCNVRNDPAGGSGPAARLLANSSSSMARTTTGSKDGVLRAPCSTSSMMPPARSSCVSPRRRTLQTACERTGTTSIATASPDVSTLTGGSVFWADGDASRSLARPRPP